MGAADRPRRTSQRGQAAQTRKQTTRANNASQPHRAPQTRGTSKSKPRTLALKVMEALYWDLLCVTQFKQITSQNSTNISNQDITAHQSFFHEGHAFITNFANGFLSPTLQGHDILAYDRCLNFVCEFGWKFFAIAAFSEAFRQAILTDELIQTSTKHWDALKNLISENKRSIEIFARSRGLNWQYILTGLTMYEMQGLPSVQDALAPEINIFTEHPHHIVQTRDGGLRWPQYKGKAQIDVLYRVHDPKKLNRLSRKKHWGRCGVCQKSFVRKCDCRLHSLAGELTELVEYEGKGVGVRTLANFKKNDVLGEYIGKISPGTDYDDPTYLLSIRRPDCDSELAITDSAHFGNWTRFMNHSCEAPNTFGPFIAGPEVTAAVTAQSGIRMFEEMTVHYGDCYWGYPPKCPCGSDGCMSLPGNHW